MFWNNLMAHKFSRKYLNNSFVKIESILCRQFDKCLNLILISPLIINTSYWSNLVVFQEIFILLFFQNFFSIPMGTIFCNSSNHSSGLIYIFVMLSLFFPIFSPLDFPKFACFFSPQTIFHYFLNNWLLLLLLLLNHFSRVRLCVTP